MATASSLNGAEYDFYIVGDNAKTWEKNVKIELQKLNKDIQCICSSDGTIGKTKLRNLLEPVEKSQKVVVGFTSTSSTQLSSGKLSYLVSTVMENHDGKLLPVLITKDAVMPAYLKALTSAHAWEDDVYQKLLNTLHGGCIKVKICEKEGVGSGNQEVNNARRLLEQFFNNKENASLEDTPIIMKMLEESVKYFKGSGIQCVRQGSIIFHLSVYSQKALKNIWKTHLSGQLFKDLAKILIPENLQTTFLDNWKTEIEEVEYTSALDKLTKQEHATSKKLWPSLEATKQHAPGMTMADQPSSHEETKHQWSVEGNTPQPIGDYQKRVPSTTHEMSGKALQFDKRDLECAICLERFRTPKTLKCMHSFCLQCLQSLMNAHGTISCPTCCQKYDIKEKDLADLTSNEMINYILEYVEKIESEKPAKCPSSNCDDNQPQYYCSECQMYICGQCITYHKMFPALRDHPLYTLNKHDEEVTNRKYQCPTHLKIIDLYCSSCKQSVCRDCKHVIRCYQNKHNVVPMKIAVDEFNERAKEVKELTEEIKNKLMGTLDSIIKDESELKLCREEIEIQEKAVIKEVKKKTKHMLEKLEEKGRKEAIDSQIKNINSKLTKLNEMLLTINIMMNKPQEAATLTEETETLKSHITTINAVRDDVLRDDIDKSFHTRISDFHPFTYLVELINRFGIGKLTIYEIAKDDESITVTKNQPFVVKVSSLVDSDVGELTATLVDSSGDETATEVKYHERKEYSIIGRCNMEGNWQMKITSGDARIRGPLVNIKVEALGLVHTIGNISDYKEHNKEENVTDVMLDADGCLLVLSFSKDVLKFNQSGSFVARLGGPQDVKAIRIHRMRNGHMVYSAYLDKRVVMCDDRFQEIRSIGKGIFQFPDGLTVNETSRIMYVADREGHCVFKFNVDDGRILGKIGSEGNEAGQLKEPTDVTLTKEGHVIIADKNSRIQQFDTNDNLMRILVGSGKDDGKVWGPHAVFIDMDGNIIVSSNHKLQLFDRNGVFIKRIDHKDDGLNLPSGITVISNRPRRVAVANYIPNNVKIFNY